jgi:hypothetical protein
VSQSPSSKKPTKSVKPAKSAKSSKPVKAPARKRPVMAAVAAGQIWQLQAGQLQVTGMGKLLASYKVFRAPGQKGVQTQMSGIANLQKYLRTNKATLISEAKVTTAA